MNLTKKNTVTKEYYIVSLHHPSFYTMTAISKRTVEVLKSLTGQQSYGDPVVKQQDISCIEYDVVLYHGGCPDGIAGAWCFWTPLHAEQRDAKVWRGVRHGTPPPYELLGKKRVILVDFCYPLDEMAKIAEVATSLTVLDHHDTAERAIASLQGDNVVKVFDMKRSGAQIAWDYMTGILESDVSDKVLPERPWFIEVVADRDLWKWEIPNSREYGTALHHGGWYRFESLESLYIMTDKQTSDVRELLLTQGKILKGVEEKKIRVCAKYSTLTTFEGYTVRLGTIDPDYRSSAGNALIEKGGCDFSATWRYVYEVDQWWVSIRASKTCDISVNKLCEKYGGGGHPCACGFAIHGRRSQEYDVGLAKGGLHDYFKPLVSESTDV